MIPLTYDLHIHSCLSPCGDNDMTPGNIVGMSALKGLDVIAVTDHNSCKNIPAVMELAQEYGIIAIPGMELCTSEEVHVVCLFEELKGAMEFDKYVYSNMMYMKNDEEIFGAQRICNSKDEITGIEDMLLIYASDISFDRVFELVKSYDGIMIPAHIEKNANSLIANLGFIPPDSKFKAAEIKDPNKKDNIVAQHSYLNHCKIIHNSDAHYLEHIHEPEYYIHVEEKTIHGVLKTLGI